MADRLTPARARAVIATAALALSTHAAAQALTDPTQPPLALMATAAGADRTEAGRAVAGPRLESIMLSSARKGAIISGQYVPLRGAYGKAVLVGISATEVKLKTGRQLEVLQLYPPTETAAATSGAKRKTEKMVKRP